MDRIYIVLFIALIGSLILLFSSSLPYEENTNQNTNFKIGDKYLESIVTKCKDGKLCFEDNTGKQYCIVDKENC